MRHGASRLTTAAAIALVCAAAGVHATAGGDPGERRVAAAPSTGAPAPSDGRVLPLTDAAAAALKADPRLARLPWIFMPIDGMPRVDEVDAAPSLVFPVGTTHQRALHALYDALSERGALPAGTSLGAPLPAGTLIEEGPAGVRVGLTAPFGVDPAGRVQPASVALPGTLSPAEVERRWADAARDGAGLPAGAWVDVPGAGG